MLQCAVTRHAHFVRLNFTALSCLSRFSFTLYADDVWIIENSACRFVDVARARNQSADPIRVEPRRAAHAVGWWGRL